MIDCCNHPYNNVINTGKDQQKQCLTCKKEFDNEDLLIESRIHNTKLYNKQKKEAIRKSNWHNWEEILGERLGLT